MQKSTAEKNGNTGSSKKEFSSICTTLLKCKKYFFLTLSRIFQNFLKYRVKILFYKYVFGHFYPN